MANIFEFLSKHGNITPEKAFGANKNILDSLFNVFDNICIYPKIRAGSVFQSGLGWECIIFKVRISGSHNHCNRKPAGTLYSRGAARQTD